MLPVVSHPEADEELEAAARWYEERQPGLGDDFLDDFELTLRRVAGDPQRPRFFREKNRKLNFNRFPYAIVYELQKDILYVKAVMHLHRQPFYWRHRQ
jgi:ParE toxin of type II toxin-antitoxin system, parDE